MAQQQPIRASPDSGFIITEEMIIERFKRTLLVFGREKAIELYENYDHTMGVFPGWEATRIKLEDILLNHEKSLKASNIQGELPPQLCTEKAMALWQKAQQAGIVDDCYQPVNLSRTEAALLAYEMATRLGISNKWKIFESLWCRNNMRIDYNNAMNQQKTQKFLDRLKNIFGSLPKK